jgi:hypothetical protein
VNTKYRIFWYEGREAYNNKKGITDNPYKIDHNSEISVSSKESVMCKSWRNGWLHQRMMSSVKEKELWQYAKSARY